MQLLKLSGPFQSSTIYVNADMIRYFRIIETPQRHTSIVMESDDEICVQETPEEIIKLLQCPILVKGGVNHKIAQASAKTLYPEQKHEDRPT